MITEQDATESAGTSADIGIMAKSRAKKREPLRQGSLGVEQHTLLKKPLDLLGKQIEMPGSFWQGRMSADERETVYKCTIIDFSLAHKFSPDAVPSQAFRLQEMGVDGGQHGFNSKAWL